MSMSCVALNAGGNLPKADIMKEFFFELVNVTDFWDIFVHTTQGVTPLRHTGNWERIKASFQRAEKKKINPNLLSAISQAIRDSPRIGCIWLVHCEGVPKFLFALPSAVDAETQEVKDVPCFWYGALAAAHQALAMIKVKPKTTYNHHDPSAEQEMSAVSEAAHDFHPLKEYQGHLTWMAKTVGEGLKRAKWNEQ